MSRATAWGPGHAWPDYGEGGLLAVTRTVETFLAGEARPTLVPLEGVRTLVILLLDGLGRDQLAQGFEADAAPSLREAGDQGGLRELTTVVPSTTASALVSLSTGTAPAAHGYLGYRLYLPDRGILADMLRVGVLGGKSSLEEVGFAPQDLLVGEPVLSSRRRGTAKAVAITRREFRGTPFTRFLYGDADVRGYQDLDEMGARIREACDGPGPRVVFAYWDGIDLACHVHGAASEAFQAALTRVDRTLVRHLADVGDDVLLLVTADHGHIDCPPKGRWEVSEDPELRSLLAVPPMGDARLPYLHAREGRQGDLQDYADDVLDEAADWMPSGEAWDAGLFGPHPDPRWRPRIGDVVLLPRENRCFTDARLPGSRGLIGRHGGTSRREMMVPLLWTFPSLAWS